MPAPLLFWDVDTQADFICPDGRLYVPGAEEIVPNLRRLTEWAAGNGVLVIASVDAHHPDDPEFRIYPPHCLVGTAGQRKIPETRLPHALIIPNQRVDLPEDLTGYRQLVLEKQQLDVFSNPNTDSLLVKLGLNYNVVLYGVVSEICVAYAGRGLLQRDYRVQVVTDAIRHLDEPRARMFLEEIKEAGGKLITTKELLTVSPRQTAA